MFEEKIKPTVRIPVQYNNHTLYTNSWALVVGINSYKQDRIKNLNYAEADAQAVAACLPALGFPEENIRVLVGEDATREAIEKILEYKFNRKMKRNDRFLFYFSGHGVTYRMIAGDEQGYMLLHDSQLMGDWPTRDKPYLDRPPHLALEMQTFLRNARALPVKHKLLLIDSCFSGFAVVNRCTEDTESSNLTQRLTTFTSKPVIQVLTAGSAGETAREVPDYKHGIFTRYLLRGLTGSPRLWHGKPAISFLDLAAYVCNHVANDPYTEQTPQIHDDGDGLFIFLSGDYTQDQTQSRLPDSDGQLGKAVSHIVRAEASQSGTHGLIRKYEKGTIYLITRTGNPALNWPEFKEGAVFRVDNGNIGLRYETMGGTKSRLGFPIADVSDAWGSRKGDWRSSGRIQFFEGGNIFYCERYGAHALTAGKIREYFGNSEDTVEDEKDTQVTGGLFGFPINEQIEVQSSSKAVGNAQRFEFGLIIEWNGKAYGITDGFFDLYQSMGEWTGELGFPIGNKMPFPSPLTKQEGEIQHFENGCMVSDKTSNTCKYIAGTIFTKWIEKKQVHGSPIYNPYPFDLRYEQLFEKGKIAGHISMIEQDSGGELLIAPETQTVITETSTGPRDREKEEKTVVVREPLPKNAYKIAIQAHNGKFVSAENGGGGRLLAKCDNIQKWESIVVFELNRRKVYLQVHNGKFISAGKGGDLNADASSPGEGETFEIIFLEDNKVALQAHSGHFVSADVNGGRDHELTASRRKIRNWEVFTLFRL